MLHQRLVRMRRARKKREGATALALHALHLVRKNNASKEIKFFDIEINVSGIDEDGELSDNLFLPAQGLTDVTRIGDKCYLKSISWNLRVIPPTDGASTGQLRAMLFYDKQNTITGVGDILLPPAATADQPNAMYNVDKRRQWVKIFDKNIMVDNVNKSFHILVRSKKFSHITQFNAGSTTVNTGSYKLIFISNALQAGADATKIAVRGLIRFNFNDS